MRSVSAAAAAAAARRPIRKRSGGGDKEWRRRTLLLLPRREGGVDISSLFFKLINCLPSGFGKCKFALSSSSDRKRQVCRVHGVRFPFLLGILALLLHRLAIPPSFRGKREEEEKSARPHITRFGASHPSRERERKRAAADKLIRDRPPSSPEEEEEREKNALFFFPRPCQKIRSRIEPKGEKSSLLLHPKAKNWINSKLTFLPAKKQEKISPRKKNPWVSGLEGKSKIDCWYWEGRRGHYSSFPLPLQRKTYKTLSISNFLACFFWEIMVL